MMKNYSGDFHRHDSTGFVGEKLYIESLSLLGQFFASF